MGAHLLLLLTSWQVLCAARICEDPGDADVILEFEAVSQLLQSAELSLHKALQFQLACGSLM